MFFSEACVSKIFLDIGKGLQQEEGRADQIQLRVWAAYRVTYDSLQYTPFYKL